VNKDLASRLRKTAKHSYLGRLLLEEAADCIDGLQVERDAALARVADLEAIRASDAQFTNTQMKRAEAAEALLGG